MNTRKQKVFVGLSGGVDSSVSAALLKEAGYDVTGVFIKVWHPDFLHCTWKEERRDAMRVCATLNIPFLDCNAEEEYKQGVVDYMIREYKAGRTPNPDVMCNKEVKFGVFLKFALERGADYVATGHYAQVKHTPEASIFIAGADKEKDQSYFLWTLRQDQLKHILFPIGHLEKPQVRVLAEKYGLHTFDKKDSQGLCFIGKIDMKEFLQRYIEPKKGEVLSSTGEVIGTHDGAVFLTIGERHGFTITKKGSHDKPYYVVAKDTYLNTITVSELPPKAGSLSTIYLESFNWNNGQAQPGTYTARIRYRQKLVPVELKTEGNKPQIIFKDTIESITPGQSLVLYEGDICLGGGIISA